MLLKQARMVNWKTWAAKHECESVVETSPVLRRKTDEPWTGRRMGAEENVRDRLVGRKEVSEMRRR